MAAMGPTRKLEHVDELASRIGLDRLLQA
jgi:hypothetical protein